MSGKSRSRTSTDGPHADVVDGTPTVTVARGALCQHFVILYYSGEKWDCGSPNCGVSSAHAHKNARNCPCPKVSGIYDIS